ncbi:hypothetical protein D3C87_453700 [compost metagenome]|uniref:hypothetical protein n=1 Tax=Achromobacter sp. Root83 TaxID=1736602 RepID=UPI00070A0884|nr:hypothetical protein [Achromobacter sp. Root83]KRC79248.1 hypothetical protein ASE30_25055 [Achromobacter sp. Root83]
MSTQRDHKPAEPKANVPKDDAQAARQSGQFGADKPDAGEQAPRRESDKTPNRKGAEFEEGGQYPGKQPGGK